MHTVIWTIEVNEGTSREDMMYGIRASSEEYKDVAGPIRTYFGISEAGKSVVEIYLWASKAEADRFFDHVWETAALRRWQAAPMRRQDVETPLVLEGSAALAA